jgi:hypothetical protein
MPFSGFTGTMLESMNNVQLPLPVAALVVNT